jgi:hypothetical protein
MPSSFLLQLRLVVVVVVMIMMMIIMIKRNKNSPVLTVFLSPKSKFNTTEKKT